MRTRTKIYLLLQCLGAFMSIGIFALAFRHDPAYVNAGFTDKVIWTGLGGALWCLFCNYWPLRAMTGFRITMPLPWTRADEKKPERYFSWPVMLMTPIAIGAPAWLFFRYDASVHGLVAASIFIVMTLFMLLVPPSDSKSAKRRFMDDFDSA